MSAPDWRDVFARAIYATDPVGVRSWEDAPASNSEDCFACADAILAAIAERGYRLHRDHDWVDDLSNPVRIALDYPHVPKNCSRCGVMFGGLADGASCEGPA